MVIFLIIVGVAFAGFLTLGFVKNAQDEKAKRKQEEEYAERLRARKELEEKAEAGDKEAQRQIEEEGTDISGYFDYHDFNVYTFDADSANRLYNIVDSWMDIAGYPNFEMEKVTENVLSTDRILGSTMYHSKGKTSRGDTLSITYHFGKFTANNLSYSLHLKVDPNIARTFEGEIQVTFTETLNTIPKGERPNPADDE